MDQIDRRQLPGNDASWYEALIAERTEAADRAAEITAGAAAVNVAGNAARTAASTAVDEVPDTREHGAPPPEVDTVAETPEPETQPEASDGKSPVVAAVEPVEQEAFARFLTAWHDVPAQRRGQEALVETLGVRSTAGNRTRWTARFPPPDRSAGPQ